VILLAAGETERERFVYFHAVAVASGDDNLITQSICRGE